MNLSNFLGELKRRNVYRVAATYAIVSWLLIQVATQVSPYFAVPNWTVRVLILLLVAFFPAALAFAWAYELTPEGLRRTEEVPLHKSIRHHTGRKLLAITSVLAAIAIGWFLIRSAGLRTMVEDSQNAASLTRDTRQDIPAKSVAVLPFANLSAEQENAFFTDGVQDEILTRIARIADLKVISRTSVQVYKSGAPRNLREIGRQLGVRHIIEGSVQRISNRVRVTVQLIDALTDSHLWAEHFDRDLADTFAIETEIADTIAHKLNAALSPDEKAAVSQPTHDMEAFDLYLRAKELITNFQDTPDRKESLLRAIRFLDEAISRDGSFALGYCWAARAHDNLYWFGHDRSAARLAQAKAAAQTALALAPDLGEAHLAQALVYYHGSRDYPRALAELELARRTLPNSAELFSLLGWIARRQARWDDALVNLKRAVDLDPRNGQVLTGLSVLYDVLRRYDDKEALYDRAAAIDPSKRDYFQMMRAQTKLERGDLAAARSLIEGLPAGYDPDGVVTYTRMQLALYDRKPEIARATLASTKFEELVGSGGFQLPVSWFEAWIARSAGDTTRAQSAFAEARRKLEPKLRETPDDALLLSQIALVDAGLGRAKEAIAEGQRAVALRPIAQDALDGAVVLTSLAMTYAWIGDVNSAIEQLAFVAKTPAGPDYGDLKYSPSWDALRGDPRFGQILASIEPPKSR
ncbi:MAG: tetratricopeptide repeat protein [Chthoniobacterales bacterium]